ncbi:MAG: hypothetical protein MPW16_04270 [Candidatus Manganitrophus sp.]|nr:MAG: hypothetical protein MPW16_04270 [Candidatus Manganitrophus sp.]
MSAQTSDNAFGASGMRVGVASAAAPGVDPLPERLLDLLQADRADLALGLRDNVGRAELLEKIGIHPVNTQRLLQKSLDPPVDLAAGSLGGEFRRRADR